MALVCSNCGVENADSAVACRRCRVPFDLEAAADGVPAPTAEAERPASLGEVCLRCEAYNEPGTTTCSNCGLPLASAANDAVAGAESAPADALHDPPQSTLSLTAELSALALSDEDAREAQRGGPQDDRSIHLEDAPHAEHVEPADLHDATPRDGFAPVRFEPDPAPALALPRPDAPRVRQTAVPATSAFAGAIQQHIPIAPPQGPPPGWGDRPEPSANKSRAPAAPSLPAAPEVFQRAKVCSGCGMSNPPAAKFCSDCGTPFAKPKAAESAPPAPTIETKPLPAPPPEPPAPAMSAHDKTDPGSFVVSDHEHQQNHEHHDTAELQPIVEEDPDLPVALEPDDRPEVLATSQEVTGRIRTDELADASAALAALKSDPSVELEAIEQLHPEEALATNEHDAVPQFREEAADPPGEFFEVDAAGVDADAAGIATPLAADESFATPVEEPIASAPLDEPPYQVSLMAVRGSAAGTAFMLGRIENALGGTESTIGFHDDPYMAPHQATVLFEEQRLLLRDEGAANGVYLRVREWAPLAPGDHFVAGQRLLRFDGPVELPAVQGGDTPFLGAPRPPGGPVRVSEILLGGKTGRSCLRTGPVIAVGKAGCDLNFPADEQLAPRHAEIRIAEDGVATVHDLGAVAAGVFLRLRERSAQDLQQGDVLRIGDQELRVDVA